MSVEGLLVVICLLAVLAAQESSAARLADVLRRPVRQQVPLVQRGFSRRHRGVAWSEASADVPAALALELRAGKSLAEALEAVAQEQQALPALSARLGRAAALAATAADAGQALRSGVGGQQLDALLLPTAACCGAAASAGLALADLLDVVADQARASRVLQGTARAELAGARSTSWVLGALPVAGVGMGQLLGARPVHVLLGTGWGAMCLGAAALLTAAGLVWLRVITARLREALT